MGCGHDAPSQRRYGQGFALHDEGLAYAEQLRCAGVRVNATKWAGVTHDFIKLSRAVPEAARAGGRRAGLACCCGSGGCGQRVGQGADLHLRPCSVAQV